MVGLSPGSLGLTSKISKHLYKERQMTLKQFLKENRAELDACIARALGLPKNPRANDDERRLWVLNDEGLYRWARSEGVKI